MIGPTVAVLVVVATMGQVDKVADTLKAEQGKYLAAATAAKSTLTKAFDTEIKKADGEFDAASVVELKSQKSLFESETKLPTAKAMQPYVTGYKTVSEKAGKAMADAFRAARDEYERMGHPDKVKAMDDAGKRFAANWRRVAGLGEVQSPAAGRTADKVLTKIIDDIHAGNIKIAELDTSIKRDAAHRMLLTKIDGQLKAAAITFSYPIEDVGESAGTTFIDVEPFEGSAEIAALRNEMDRFDELALSKAEIAKIKPGQRLVVSGTVRIASAQQFPMRGTLMIATIVDEHYSAGYGLFLTNVKMRVMPAPAAVPTE